MTAIASAKAKLSPESQTITGNPINKPLLLDLNFAGCQSLFVESEDDCNSSDSAKNSAAFLTALTRGIEAFRLGSKLSNSKVNQNLLGSFHLNLSSNPGLSLGGGVQNQDSLRDAARGLGECLRGITGPIMIDLRGCGTVESVSDHSE